MAPSPWRSLMVALLLLVVAVAGHDGDQGDLDWKAELWSVLPYKPIDYSSPQTNNSYQADPTFDAKGMQPLYQLADFFLRISFKKDILPPDTDLVNKDPTTITFTDIQREWKPLAQHYVGLLILLGLGLLFCIGMLCGGCIFCCCRCGGRCGANGPILEKRRDPCKRITLSIVLSALVVAVLFGVVCAFVTNEYLERGVQQFPNRVKTSLNDAQLYLENIKIEVNTSLVQNFEQLQEVVDDMLHHSGGIVEDALAEVSNAVAIVNLTDIVDQLGNISDSLVQVQNLTLGLQEDYKTLGDQLDQVIQLAHNLQGLCQKDPSCNDTLQHHLLTLGTGANFTQLLNRYFPQLPSLDNVTANLNKFINQGIVADVNLGTQELNRLGTKIQEQVNTTVTEVSKKMMTAGEGLKNISYSFSSILDELDVSKETSMLDHLNGYIDKYSRYRYYVDLGVCIILLTILLCFVGGLFCGFCGKSPDGIYGDDCCNRGTGCRFLMAGVYLAFLLSSILMLVTIIHFLIGSVSEKYVCEQIENPNNSQIFRTLNNRFQEEFLKNRKWDFDTDLLRIWNRCNQNSSLYETLQPTGAFNLSEVQDYIRKLNIDAEINKMIDQVHYSGNVSLLNNDTREELQQLANSGLTHINFTVFTDVLSEKITTADLGSVIALVDNTASKLPPELAQLATQLRNVSGSMKELQKMVKVMTKNVDHLKDLTNDLQHKLKFNHNSFEDAIVTLVNITEDAEQYLKHYGEDKLKNLTKRFADEIIHHMVSYVNRSHDILMNEMGRCGPISRAVNASVSAVCLDVVEPLNGFWVSVGWCLMLFIPCMILAVSAAKLYRKSEPYGGVLIDSEYLYDAYADRDNIPLANVHGKKGRRSYSERESYENHSGYVVDGGGPLTPSFPSLRAGSRGNLRLAHAERYGDMAPKNWDSPPGLPLHYAPPLLSSSEYERPPPYYYPGPGDLK